ncbi:glycogenin glucosyltransferase [Coemansia sp. RSA 2706]|nr:glycogenin glucosyltransferase [Coemansia sp. RSA 2706]KAJ2313486.1 glycogenin glucosyltransferase [Coemansia sp. RSA 2705]KAJ2320867.1 glycogenin glucosyltransferase [Coemansia sp. RSA 2704]
MASNPTTARVCFATLLTTDSYVPGALTLAASLRATGTSHEIICLVADGQLSRSALERLELAFDRVVCVPILQSADTANLALLGRPDLGSTVTKIGIWSLTEYARIAYLDADTLVLGSIDSLLDVSSNDMAIGHDIRPNGGMENAGLLAAAPDLGWPDMFNSGVFVAQPSMATHRHLVQLLATRGSFDGGDQGLLNTYFSDWSRADHTRRLPFAYNTTSTSFYSYAPAFAHFAHSIKIVHFIGAQKPWKQSRDSNGALAHEDSTNTPFAMFVEKWWQIHDAHVLQWCPEERPNGSGTLPSSAKQSDNSGTNNTSSAHSLDNAWIKDRAVPAVIDQMPADGSWGAFTPAPDFALSASLSSSSNSSKTNVRAS